MATSKHKQRRKPSKPSRSFPLTAHNNGQWCKKIRGKIHFFGVWEDPQVALEKYLHVAADLHAGRQPQIQSIPADGPTVKHICNHFLTYQLQKVEAGEITARWLEDCRRVVESFARFAGSGRLVSDLRPEDFRRFRQRLASKGLNGRGHGLGIHALNRTITVVKGMLKYAYEMDLLDRPVKYGRAFEKPSTASIRKARQAAQQENGKRLFAEAEILAMLKAAFHPFPAMILLALNGGFGNTDCARLPVTAVDLEGAVIDFGRTKTGIERVVPLWPETVAALREALARRPKPADAETENLVFLTPSGLAWVREKVHRTEDRGIRKVVLVDAVCREFGKLIHRLGLKRKGLGFYALRHTFRTWADEVKDQHAIHRIMGHAIPRMSGIYVEEIGLDRLRAVVDHVRAKLFGAEE